MKKYLRKKLLDVDLQKNNFLNFSNLKIVQFLYLFNKIIISFLILIFVFFNEYL